ncbi:WD repeat-containing protein 7-like isoform X4 [Gigantopelta aegis]|uniref:WD repeat-containing protein 7-like isoform X4 n=1 Tax=Gigantopelta aegis TaxID=1735272 RepID=UPI001B88B241|nr:WD repeat-containing protein 7-like isoform X4 [Gigantopelta aegis]
MSSGSSLVVPMVLWGRHAPTHCISAILMTADMKNIVTGCNDGQICIWDITDNWQLFPRSMLFGHTTAITCLAPGSEEPDEQYVVSASENGEMCLWDISDGRCIENTKMTMVHTDIIAYKFQLSKELRLVCSGYYPEIHVIDPSSFEILFSLCSKVVPDWISACCVLRPVKRDGTSDDVVLAVSNSGTVKVWTLSSEPKAKIVFEDESKQIRCLNAQTLTCCSYNQRTVLIVCSKYWQIYDAGDFSLLCSESNRCGERWAGGDFISVDRVIVWSSDGKGYLYKLPTNLLKGKAVQRTRSRSSSSSSTANAESADYHQHHQPTSPHAYYILNLYSEQSLVCSPAMVYQYTKEEKPQKLLLRGDSEGRVVIWKLPDVSERQMTLVRQESFDRLPALPPQCKTTLQDVWDCMYRHPPGVLDGVCDESERSLHITSTIYIPSQGKLVCGRENGTIVIIPAIHCIMLQLLTSKTLSAKNIPVKILQGHDGRVTCLLYPFNESTRYEPQHLLSGGADFSVILWDINSGCKVHTFTVHGGELTHMLVPPGNCNTRILYSVCSVASDHSVTLLSLKERKCIMLAGRHLFPVQTIRWRPLDDFMLVSCSDGTVYVWQMETGHLDRVVHGITAEEILNNCDENATPMESLTNPNITLAQAFKRRNLATFKNLAQQKLQQHQQQQQAQGRKSDLIKPTGFPLHIQGVRTNIRDPDAHVLFFDTEAMIVQLLTEEYALMSPGELEARGLLGTQDEQMKMNEPDTDPQQKLIGLINKAKERAENVGQKIQSKVEMAGINIPTQPSTKTSPSKVVSNQPRSSSAMSRPESIPITDSLTLESAQLFMSCLHAWGLDPDLDKLCTNKLGLLKPQCPISFGLLSRQGHMSLMLPGWHKRVCQVELSALKGDNPVAAKTLSEQARMHGESLKDRRPSSEPMKPTLLAQRSGSVPFDVEHLMFVSEDASVPMSGPPFADPPVPTISKIGENLLLQETRIFSAKARWQISSGVTTQHLLSVISVANTLMSMSHSSFLRQRQSKRKKDLVYSGHHGLVVFDGPDSGDGGVDDDDAMGMQQAQIKQGWSLLAALHCVLLPELVGATHYHSPQLEMLARRWQDRCLEIREAAQALLLAELRRIGPEGRKGIVDEWAPSLPTYVDPQHSLLSDTPGQKEDEEEDEEDDEQMLAGDSPAHKVSVSFESRRRQATAIVMLGVIGAEFGHEIEPSRRKPEEVKKGKKNVQEGFSLANYNLARHTSKALTFLLLTPPSSRLPSHTPIRRAAIDLLGRGFTVWEPHLDVSSVLLGLLELAVDAERLLPSMTYGLPLTPAADACRTAHHSLSLIATARPPTFIITMAKEVARYNAQLQNTQSQHSQLQNSVLIRARYEILHVIELLVEKMPNDVADLLLEVMDVTMHCLEMSQLKMKGLQELFPAICRFSMVSFCAQTKRIWVGSKNGGLALYEMKQHAKTQTISAHKGPVIAVSVNQDGKFLATFSHVDKKLKFWQTAASTLFGIGSQQTKCIRQYTTPPCHTTPVTNILKLVRLVWIDNRTVVLLTVDGTETKYSV